jgi:SPOR domain
MELGRLARWRSLWCGLSVAAVLAAASPAYAAPDQVTLDMARQALETGQPAVAIHTLSVLLARHGLKGQDLAKVLYLRGIALAKTGKAAAAIVDLDKALGAKAGLSDDDRQAALIARATAFTAAHSPDAALAWPEPQETATAAAPSERAAEAGTLPWLSPKAGIPAGTPANAPPGGAKPVAVKINTPPPGSDSAFDSMIGGLFSFGVVAPVTPASVTQPPAEGAPAAVVAPAVAPAAALLAPQPVVSPDTTDWKPSGLTMAAPISVPAPKSAIRPGLYLQIASLRTESDAQAMADTMARQHAATLAGLPPVVVPAVLGNMGAFYAVRVGPLASRAAGTALCGKLRKEGVDCYFASQ